jgi:hypothetical protein
VLRRSHALAAAVVVASAAGFLLFRGSPPPPDPGVSESLARDRSARVSSLGYAVSLQVPESRTEPVRVDVIRS